MALGLKIVLLIASIILIISILLQSSNSAGLSGSIRLQSPSIPSITES